MTPMLWPMATGALAGLGLYLFIRILLRPRPGVATLVARIDAGSRSMQTHTLSEFDTSFAEMSRRGRSVMTALADRLELVAARRGWQLARHRADLTILNRSVGAMLATKVTSALIMLLVAPLAWGAARLGGLDLGGTIPLGVALLLGDSIIAPNGGNVLRLLPPPELLWASLGRLSIPSLEDTVVTRRGDTLQADIGTDPVWRVTVGPGGLARLDWALADKPTHVLVALGANDALRGSSPDVTQRNLQAIIDRLHGRKGIEVAGVGRQLQRLARKERQQAAAPAAHRTVAVIHLAEAFAGVERIGDASAMTAACVTHEGVPGMGCRESTARPGLVGRRRHAGVHDGCVRTTTAMRRPPARRATTAMPGPARAAPVAPRACPRSRLRSG